MKEKTIGKKLLFTVFSLALFYLTISLIQNLISTQNYVFETTESAIVAGMINLYATGVFAMLGFVFPTYKLIPQAYFKIHNARILKTIYSFLGVSYFRILLLLAFWGKLKNRKKYFNGNRSGLTNFVYQSKQSEFGHLAAFVAISIVTILLAIKGFWNMFYFTFAVNFIGNFYPIILQRHHRIRIEKLGL